ncbi:hypothetical protein [Streptosporangium sp. NPDC006007]|uniref:hypothetical protein n=1 Tax=Streptosporangium sp. NPDC006007 TaxID=3154575 RepID=UPI0033B40ACF
MVIEICECRRTRIATRGWTSRAARSEAQVCRVSWTRIVGTPARRQWASKARLKLRGSIGVPFRVVKTRSESCHFSPAALQASSWMCRRCLSAVMHRPRSGSEAVESSVLVVYRWRSWPRPRLS